MRRGEVLGALCRGEREDIAYLTTFDIDEPHVIPARQPDRASALRRDLHPGHGVRQLHASSQRARSMEG